MPSESVDTFEWVEGVQEELLNILLTDRDFFVRTLSLVKPHYFQRGLYQELTELSQQFFNKYHQTITCALLQEGLRIKRDGDDNIDSLFKEVHSLCQPRDSGVKSREHLLVEVVEFAKIQAMKSAILQSVNELQQQNYGRIEELVREALLVSPDINLGLDYFKDLKERYHRELVASESDRFTTGFESLDRELDGGLGRKELGMIYSPPGVGKSLWLVKIGAANLLKGKRVLYFSMEMSEDRIGARFDSVLGLVDVSDRMAKFAALQKRLETIREITGDNLVIKEYPTGSSDVNTLRSYLVSLKNFRGWVPDLILLDYADLMMPVSGKGLELWQRQQRIYEEVRGFGVEGNFCMYTASQSNRQARQVSIITDNELGDSYGKLRVVDAAWSLNCTLDEKVHSCGRVFVVKHRNAKSGYIVPLRFDFPTLRLIETTKDQYDRMMAGGDPSDSSP